MNTPAPSSSFRLRLTALAVVVICLFAALFARLWYLQVINAKSAQAAAVANAVRTVYIPAPRGEILDRNGRVIVGNVLAEVVSVEQDSALTDPDMINNLAALLDTTPKALMAAVKNPQYNPYQPVPVAQAVAPSVVLTLEEHSDEFPGVQVTQETIRYYPYGDTAANIVGYVGQITGAELKKLAGQGYQPGDQIGQAGIEAEYEKYLRGKPGVEKLQVDSQGHVLGQISYSPPVPGDNIRLSIDLNLQQTAEQSIQNALVAARNGPIDPTTGRHFAAPAGAAVVEDPRNGQILALATDPRYDPAEFVGGISEANYQALQNAPGDPLLDRSVQGEYQPGSTFKLVTATAALNDGLLTPGTIYDDTGGITVGGEHFSNDNSASYGYIDLTTAVTVSSDAFFYTLGEDFWNDRGSLGEDALQNVAAAYGLGSSTGIDLPYEAPGLVPTPQVLVREHSQDPTAYPYDYWTTGDSVQTAIGELQDLVTPLQLADAYSTFANGGTLYRPRVAMDAETPQGKVVATFPAPVRGQVTLSAPNRAALLAGFVGVVNNPKGTAYADFAGKPTAALDIAGKTGTAQVGNGNQDTSVFTSFAPATDPQYVVDTFLEQAGYGAQAAAPVVEDIWQEILTEEQDGVPAPGNVPTLGQVEPTTTTTLPPPATTTSTTTATTTSSTSTATATTVAPAATTAPVATVPATTVAPSTLAPTTAATTAVTTAPTTAPTTVATASLGGGRP